MNPKTQMTMHEAFKCKGAAKIEYNIEENVNALIDRYGIERIGFLTLTFHENLCPMEGQRRLNSFMTSFVRRKEIILDYIAVVEFQKRGAVHYHLVCAFADDIRTGYSFDLKVNANHALRNLRKQFRAALPRYNFGYIFDLQPVRKSKEALAKYVSKYICKAILYRNLGKIEEAAKALLDSKPFPRGMRIYRISRAKKGQSCFRRVKLPFAWNTASGQLWRAKIGYLCKRLGKDFGMKLSFGSRWCYNLKDYILGLALPENELARLTIQAREQYQLSFAKTP